MKYLAIILLLSLPLVAGTYYVSPTGSAPWSGAGNCTSSATPCSLATANTNAAAGDTVNLRGGTYGTAITPTNSGTNISTRITFIAYTGETPTLTTSGTDVELNGNGYIRISGLTIAETAFVTPVRIENGAHHIEFDHNTVSNTGLPKYLLWLSGRGTSCPPPSGTGAACLWVTHVWIHHNTFTASGSAGGGTGCTDDGFDAVKIGELITGSGSEDDNYNTIENNVFIHGGHAAFATWGRFEVIRNNVFRNEPWSSGCANHTLPTYNTYTYGNSEVISGTGAITFQEPNFASYNGSFGHRSFDSEDFYGRWMFNLIESNRVGDSGVNPANDGAEALTLGISQTIVRYNNVYAAMSAGIMLKYDSHQSSSSGYGGTYNRIYNNTVIQSGYGYPTALTVGGAYDSTTPWGESAVAVYCSSQKNNCSTFTSAEGNVLKNNIFRLSAGYSKFGSDVLVKSGGNNAWSEFTAGNIGNNWCTSTQTSSGGCSTSGDPLFTNPDVSNPASTTLPDIRLQSTSTAIDGGTSLTTTMNSGSGATAMTVADAMYFQDGTWGSDLSKLSAGLGGTLQPDWICVGTVSNCAQLSAVTYGTNTAPAGTLTLASPLTWSNSAPVWLYRKSDGSIVLNGSAPDYGASEYIPPSPGVFIASGVKFTSGIRLGATSSTLTSIGYTGTDVVQWPATIPNVGGATKVTTAVYDTSFGSPAPIYRCTDSLTIPNPGTNSSVTGGIGGSGAGILINLNATLFHVNTGNGADAIVMFNPATGQCGDPNTGRAITTDKNSAGGGDAVHFADFGAGNFSLSQNMLWYSFGGGTGSNATTVLPVTFATAAAPTNIQYTWGSQIADFANGLPNASNTPEWAGTTSYAFGNYVKHTLTASEYWTWASGTAVQQGDIMLLSGCAYKVTTAGTTGGTVPTGHTTCNTNSLPLDGSVKWKDLGGPAAFVYQLTSAGGTSGGSTPSFTTTCAGCVSHHADFMATVTDSTLTWTNVGVAQNPGGIGWISWGGTSADDTKFAETVNTNSYGYSGNYTRCQGGQDCGLWLMEYDQTANKYYLFNTFTGIQSSTTCSGAGGTTCAAPVTQGQIATNITALPTNGFCQFGLHNEKMNRDGTYAVVVQQGNQFGGTCTALNFYVWRPLQTFSGTTQLLVFAHGLNHWTTGQTYVAALNDSGYTSPSGVFLTYTPLNNPAATGAFPACTAGAGNCPLIFWEGHPCNDTPSNEPACTLSISIDSHPSMAYNPGGTDNSPVCTSAYNYASLSPIETYPYQGEEICIKSSTTWTDSSAPATNPAYRLTHSFNDGTNDQFNTQFGISQYSQDGHWLFFTTDWDSTLGTKDGSDPTCGNTFPCTGGFQVAAPTGHNCLGGQPWQANHSYALGTVLHPIQGTGGGGTIYEPVQAVAVTGTGTSGATHPAWTTTDPVGTTYTDNQVTWKVLATQGNCRGDLFVVKTAN